MIVSDQLTKKFTIRITKKLNGIKMNPYQPPRNEIQDKISWKSIALSLVALIAMVNVLLLYLLIVGAMVRWLS